MNAVYFNGLWSKPFEEDTTLNLPFYSSSGGTRQVPMMSQSGTYKYYQDEFVQLIALPYKGDVTAYIVLPVTKTDHSSFPQSLRSGLWESWLARTETVLGSIHLPRFKVDHRAQLRSVLTALGMSRAFDQNRAEFEEVHSGGLPVFVDDVLHRAMVEVNERGTEAAAAAVVHYKLDKVGPPLLFFMNVDRPFLFVVRDESTGTIKFMGWIADPI